MDEGQRGERLANAALKPAPVALGVREFTRKPSAAAHPSAVRDAPLQTALNCSLHRPHGSCKRSVAAATEGKSNGRGVGGVGEFQIKEALDRLDDDDGVLSVIKVIGQD